MNIETWRVWSDPGYIRTILREIGLQKSRAGEGRSASYQVKRIQPVRASD